MLIRFILCQFSNGKWGFATKTPAQKIKNLVFSGRLSVFNKSKGASTSPSYSPIKDCECYIFLDDEYQTPDAIEMMQELFKDGAYLLCELVNDELVASDEEPMTLEDVKASDLEVAKPHVYASSPSVAS